MKRRPITGWGERQSGRYRRDGGCSHCGGARDRRGRYCKACHAAYMRANRPKHGELTVEQRRRSNCRAYANVYQRRGKLAPQPCEGCGGEAEKHHDDYGRPLLVRWLCRSCHLEYHRLGFIRSYRPVTRPAGLTVKFQCS